MTDNLVNWGLKRSGWFKTFVDADGNETYGPITEFVTQRTMNLNPVGEVTRVYANGTVLFVGKQNSGYNGTMEFTSVPDDFAEYALDEKKDAMGVLYEKQEATVNHIGMVWEWVQDAKNIRHIIYKAIVNRPTSEANTSGDEGRKNQQNKTLTIEVIPRKDEIVKARTTVDGDPTVYDNWFNTVYQPGIVGAQLVTVTVTDSVSAAPLGGVMVMTGEGTVGYTAETGVVVFSLPAGTYDLFVSKSGYTSLLESVTVATAPVDKDVSLVAG